MFLRESHRRSVGACARSDGRFIDAPVVRHEIWNDDRRRKQRQVVGHWTVDLDAALAMRPPAQRESRETPQRAASQKHERERPIDPHGIPTSCSLRCEEPSPDRSLGAQPGASQTTRPRPAQRRPHGRVGARASRRWIRGDAERSPSSSYGFRRQRAQPRWGGQVREHDSDQPAQRDLRGRPRGHSSGSTR